MNKLAQRVFVIVAFIAVIGLLAYESKPHFDRGLIQLKRNNNSAQRSWNLFYGQRFVFYDGSFRYKRDFQQIEKMIAPGHTVLTDVASSYYAATYLPTYVRNIHRHHGRWQSPLWNKMLDQRVHCNLHLESFFLKFQEFLDADTVLSESENQPRLRYVLVNKDNNNKNVRLDCLSNRRALFMQNVVRIFELKYEGEYLNLYEVNDDLSASATKSH